MMFFVLSSSAKTTTSLSSSAQSESLTLSGAISTVAGIVKDPPGFTVYGIAATLTSLDQPEGAAIDAAGNLYFSTNRNFHRILTVTASTGLLTVVAGTGNGRFSGDGGLATSAALFSPRGISLDKFGNIFVADEVNHRIRKITVSTGIITTVAGKGKRYPFLPAVDNVAATSSELDYPKDVAVDTFGNIYIADTGYGRVRKVTASTGIITTLGGNGKAYGVPTLPALNVAATASSFFSLVGVAVDTSGNVFFTDAFFNSIYKITAGTGLLTVVAGTNSWHYGYNGNDFPATTALLDAPAYITLDALGNIFFSDVDNHLIRKVSASTGNITIVAGSVTSPCIYSKNDGNNVFVSLCYPGGIAVDTAGSVYFCESGLVRKITYSVVTPSAAVIRAPSVTPAVSTRTVYPTAPTHLPTSKPAPTASALPGIITTVAGRRGSDRVTRVYNSTATSTSLGSTKGVAVDTAGNLFITTQGRILKITASTGLLTAVAGTGNGSFSGDGGLATSAELHHPGGISLDKFGNIFVADEVNHRIRKITVSTGIITTVAGNGKSIYPILPGVDNVAATSSQLDYPKDVAVDTFGNIYIADTGYGRVRKVTASTGIITTYAYGNRYGTSVLGPRNFYPTGVTVDTAGNVFISDAFFNSIYKITASTGLLSVVAGQGRWNSGYNGDDIPASTATLKYPCDITVDTLGNIFFVDEGNKRIRKITASTGIISTVAGTSWFSFHDCISNEFVGDGKDATLAMICYPQGIAVDTAGNVYLCDASLVRKVTYSAVTPSSVVIRAPSVTPVSSMTVSPTAGTPLLTATPTPTTTTTTRPTLIPTGTGSVSISSAPAVAPAVSSVTVSPSAGTPLPTATPTPITTTTTRPTLIPTGTGSVSISSAPAVAPAVSSVTVSPSAGTPLLTATPTPITTTTTRPTLIPTETGGASMSSAPAAAPAVSSMTASPTAGTPLLTPSASISSSPVMSSPTGSQSSSTTRTTGARHLMIILLSSVLVLHLH